MRIIPGAAQIGDAERIGLSLLPARIPEREQLAAGREDPLTKLAQGRIAPSMAPASTEPRTPRIELRVAALCRFEE